MDFSPKHWMFNSWFVWSEVNDQHAYVAKMEKSSERQCYEWDYSIWMQSATKRNKILLHIYFETAFKYWILNISLYFELMWKYTSKASLKLKVKMENFKLIGDRWSKSRSWSVASQQTKSKSIKKKKSACLSGSNI